MTWKRMRGEIDAHIEEKALDLIESGVPEREAWDRARREFGNATLATEESRAVWIWTWLQHLAQDLRYAFRGMASNRAFTLLAVTSLALGIGANTSIFSLMDAILLRSLPVEDPESLAVLKFRRPGASGSGSAVSGDGATGKMAMHTASGGSFDGAFSIFPYPAFETFQQRSDLFTSVWGYHGRPRQRLTVDGSATLGDCVYVSGEYFRGLGIQASAGRLLMSEDDRADAPPVAVIDNAFAQQRFGRPSDAIGKAVALNGVSFTVVGVAPPGFLGVNPVWSPQIYVPLHSILETQPADRTHDGTLFSETWVYWLDVMARLKPGVGRQQAQAALDPAFAAYFTEYSGDTPEKARMIVQEGAGGLDGLRRRYSQPLYLLMAMVGLILVIACANIASLLLARASARRRELAVRLSMGASRFRVIRQLLTESLLLSFTGGAVGLLVAWWGVQTLTALAGGGREDFTLRAELNWPVLAVTFALATVAGIAFGLAPAWQSTKVDVLPELRNVRSPGGGTARRGFPVNLRQVLVAAQISLSLLLLIGAGLFVRTLSKLESLELGFNPENLLLLEINARQAGYNLPAALEFHETLRQRLETIPGVRGATIARHSQLDGGTTGLQFTVPGSLSEDQATSLQAAGPNYLTTMQIPILAGRDLAVADRYRKPIAVVASESFVRKHFGAENPLGRRMSMRYGGEHEVEIVGIAKDARYGSLKDGPPAMLYVDYHHNEGFSNADVSVVLRTTGDPVAMATTAREILRQADPGVPVTISTQAAQIDSVIVQEIVFARLCTAFAALALMISCVGLYGTTAYSVARRTSEIGIRMALGARRGTVLSMVLRETAALGLAGLAIGLPIALAASKLVASFLFDLQPNDPAAIAGAVAILVAAALAAAYGPARRATRIDPMAALRHE